MRVANEPAHLTRFKLAIIHNRWTLDFAVEVSIPLAHPSLGRPCHKAIVCLCQES